MHSRGVDYVAKLIDPAGNETDTLYAGQAWSDPVVQNYTPEKIIPVGSKIDVTCTYNNASDTDVIQGFTTKDEMCMFISLYYPRDPKTEFCSTTGKDQPDNLALHIGDGAKSCADQLGCLQAARPWQEDKGASIQKCFADTCGEAPSKALNDFLGCQAVATSNACQSSCTNPSAATCQQCVGRECAPQYNACLNATCASH
jgi:hypothetical protein